MDSGRGQILVPVAGNGCGRGHKNNLARAGLRYMYPRRFYLLPSLDCASEVTVGIY
jgi:hypothetical protein